MDLNSMKTDRLTSIIINMKYLLFFMFCVSQVSADTYTIQWQKNDQVEQYSMDILCVETGFSTLKRYSKDTESVDIELAPNQTYKIIVFASSKTSQLIPSNTLTIRTSKIKPAPRFKAPQIKAIKRE